APVQAICSGIGGMVTPLSLMIIGVMLSESRFSVILREKRSYVAVLLRNLLVPLLSIPLLKLLPLGLDARLCVLIFLTCPCGTLTSIYAIKCDIEPEFSAHAVLLSTILFAATLPVVLAVGQAVLA
ncbi:MAG: AEC family transporter, partial [bacterium]